MEAETERGMGAAMTDAERQKLCETLRAWASTPLLTDRPGSLSLLGDFIREAANEIEGLIGEVKNWELWARSQPTYTQSLDNRISELERKAPW